MAFALISLDFESLTKRPNYFTHAEQPPFCKEFMAKLNAPIVKRNAEKEAALGRPLTKTETEHLFTTCAIQASHAFNYTNLTIPGASFWRANPSIPGGNGNYMMAVNEWEDWLTRRFGPTDDLKKVKSTRLYEPIMGRKGILICGGAHVEFWDGKDLLQNSRGAMMSPEITTSQKRVLFWEIDFVSPLQQSGPSWVNGWWSVYDGNQYYYYFNFPYVSYVKKAPLGGSAPAPANPANRGMVRPNDHGVTIRWNPSGGVSVEETFTRLNWSSETDMNGNSSKYSPLYARKIR